MSGPVGPAPGASGHQFPHLRRPLETGDQQLALQLHLLRQLVAELSEVLDLILGFRGKSKYQIVVPDAFADAATESSVTRAAELVQQAFAANKITLPVVLSFRRGSQSERMFWSRTLEKGKVTDADLETAIKLMTEHRALEDTIKRAHHYGEMARDALALFPASPMKQALEEAVEFCTARTH